MRTRIKGLVAVVIASAATGGALAAPASADPPRFQAVASCQVEPGFISIGVTGPAGFAQRSAIAGLNLALEGLGEKCIPGTRETSVERVQD